MHYQMPEPIKATLYLLSEAAEAAVSAVAYRGIAFVSGNCASDGSYGAADLGTDPYAYLGTPEASGATFAQRAA